MAFHQWFKCEIPQLISTIRQKLQVGVAVEPQTHRPTELFFLVKRDTDVCFEILCEIALKVCFLELNVDVPFITY